MGGELGCVALAAAGPPREICLGASSTSSCTGGLLRARDESRGRGSNPAWSKVFGACKMALLHTANVGRVEDVAAVCTLTSKTLCLSSSEDGEDEMIRMR